MATIKKYNLAGKEVGTVEIEDGSLLKEANSQMIKDYLIALRANQRQWNANTKTRAEVCHSGQKPHPQKGTGRARQGYLGATQYKGGGRPHGPKSKVDQHVYVNKKEKKAAIRYLLTEKIQNNQLVVLDYSALKKPQTKQVVNFLKALSLQGKRVLYLGAPTDSLQEENLVRSMRNIPKAEFKQAVQANGYDLALTNHVIVLESAWEQFLKIVQG